MAVPHHQGNAVNMYAAIAAEQAQRLARLRHQPRTVTDQRLTIYIEPDDDDDTAEDDELPDEDEPVWVRPDVCATCGGRIYALQNCLKCYPVVELGSKTRAETMNPDTQRKMTARAHGRRFYKSMTPCKTCSDPEPTRHCVGDRCVVCTAAAAARGEYNEVATVPIVVLPKPKRVRTYTPKPVAPIKVAAPPKPPVDRHAPKSEQHRARIAAAAWRRYHPDTLSR